MFSEIQLAEKDKRQLIVNNSDIAAKDIHGKFDLLYLFIYLFILLEHGS